MRGRQRLRLLIALPVVSALIGLLAVGTTATQAATGDCTASGGVVVIVDYAGLGLGIERGCATNPSNGLDALNSAGFWTAFVPKYGTQFICQIRDEPTDQTCVNTPPASAYWSYWYALAGQSTWSYNGLGATNRTPPPGSVDAWRFGDGSAQPAISPAQARGDQPTPTPTPTPTVSQPEPIATAPAAGQSPLPVAPTRAPSTSAPSASASVPAAGTTAPSPSPLPAEASASPEISASPSGSDSGAFSPSPSASGPRVVDVQPASARSSTGGSGSVLPTILGVALVAAVAGAGGFAAWRRAKQAQ